jgi:hypothetical protein
LTFLSAVSACGESSVPTQRPFLKRAIAPPWSYTKDIAASQYWPGKYSAENRRSFPYFFISLAFTAWYSARLVGILRIPAAR